jgi:formylglycine-generating enzyme required for sulfatase activity
VEFGLPTEAQWEYAARGARSGGYKYAGTTNNLDDFAWYQGNSDGESHDVATKRPNSLGLFDMSGNVSEWCHDWWGDYPRIDLVNPTGPSTGPAHILRGGNFECPDIILRVSHRMGDRPNSKNKAFGLRLAIEISPSKRAAYSIYSEIQRKSAPKNNRNKIETNEGLILY